MSDFFCTYWTECQQPVDPMKYHSKWKRNQSVFVIGIVVERTLSNILVFILYLCTLHGFCNYSCDFFEMPQSIINEVATIFTIFVVFHRVGLAYYEYYRVQKRLNLLISPFVLNIDSKHPDYIYIKYHIYKESMQEKKNAELKNGVMRWRFRRKTNNMLNYLHFQNWQSVIVHPVGNWWKSVKHSIAWRLLEVAKNGDYHDRLKAVRQLAKIDHLKGNLFEFKSS